MSATANTVLLAAAIAFFSAAYRLSWAASVAPEALPLPRRVRLPRLLRIYRLSLLLAFLSCIAMAVHLALRDVVDIGPLGSQVALWAGAVLLAVALWFMAESRRGR